MRFPQQIGTLGNFPHFPVHKLSLPRIEYNTQLANFLKVKQSPPSIFQYLAIRGTACTPRHQPLNPSSSATTLYCTVVPKM